MIRHPERYEKWAEVVKQQESSGLSVAAYCPSGQNTRPRIELTAPVGGMR